MSTPTPSRRLRIVVGEPGLAGDDRGAATIARALRDAGHEVVRTGPHQTPEQVVETAIQEDADLIGLSVAAGAHTALLARLVELLREREADDIVVFASGTIPDEDVPLLRAAGVAEVFAPGTPTTDITGWVTEYVAEADADDSADPGADRGADA